MYDNIIISRFLVWLYTTFVGLSFMKQSFLKFRILVYEGVIEINVEYPKKIIYKRKYHYTGTSYSLVKDLFWILGLRNIFFTFVEF